LCGINTSLRGREEKTVKEGDEIILCLNYVVAPSERKGRGGKNEEKKEKGRRKTNLAGIGGGEKKKNNSKKKGKGVAACRVTPAWRGRGGKERGVKKKKKKKRKGGLLT